MKAIHFNKFGIENLELVDIPKPKINANEILVKITAASLQYLDLQVVKGSINPDLPLPFVPGTEGAGVVEEVGDAVILWKKGDRVIIPFIPRWDSGITTTYKNAFRTGVNVQGVLTDYSIQSGNTLVRSPKNISDAQAATLSCVGLTAWKHLMLADVKAGQTILTQGTGGVSLFAIQLAKAAGLKVIATTGSADKESRLRELGVDAVINYKKVGTLSEEVIRLNDGKGVDLTLEVGGKETIEQSILSCKENGYVGLVGFLTGRNLSFDIMPLLMNYIRLQGFGVGNAQDLTDLVKAIETNNIQPIIDSSFDFESTKKAFIKVEKESTFGKIVIEF